jgi:hypothetical protein
MRVETLTVETLTVDTLTVETLTVKTLTVETLAVEKLTFETLTVETLTVETLTVETLTVETLTGAAFIEYNIYLKQQKQQNTINYAYCYKLTYLLTYFMQQSPSSEANRFSASQEIPEFYATRRFITVFTSARHLFLS